MGARRLQFSGCNMDKECEHGHDFHPAGRSYFKLIQGDGNPFTSIADHTVEYQMLYCHRCGTTKEIISRDHRKGISNG